jgi:hypothetical protein
MYCAGHGLGCACAGIELGFAWDELGMGLVVMVCSGSVLASDNLDLHLAGLGLSLPVPRPAWSEVASVWAGVW